MWRMNLDRQSRNRVNHPPLRKTAKERPPGSSKTSQKVGQSVQQGTPSFAYLFAYPLKTFCSIGKNGAAGEIRTPDLVLRRHALYPSELQPRTFITEGSKSPTRHSRRYGDGA
jgi:hypothetical protein